MLAGTSSSKQLSLQDHQGHGKKVGISASRRPPVWIWRRSGWPRMRGSDSRRSARRRACAPAAIGTGRRHRVPAMITLREIDAGQARSVDPISLGDAADARRSLCRVSGHDRQAAAGAARRARRDLREHSPTCGRIANGQLDYLKSSRNRTTRSSTRSSTSHVIKELSATAVSRKPDRHRTRHCGTRLEHA